MALTDEQLDRLEEYLDGALSPDEVRGVERQVAEEPAWSAAVEGLRADRAARAGVFGALEPSADASRALANRIIGVSAARWRRRATFVRLTRVLGGVAACVLVSFGAGWLSRGKPMTPANHGVAVTSTPASSQATGYQVTLTDGQGRVIGVQKFGSLEQATEFAHDVRAWQERQQKMRDGAAVFVADQY